MTSSRKKSSKKPTSSRTAQLEEKLDDLVSILRASQGGQPQAGQPHVSQAAFVQVQDYQSPQNSMSSAGRHATTSQPSGYASSDAYSSRLDSLATAATSTTTRPRIRGCGTANTTGLEMIPGHPTSQPAAPLRDTDKQPEPTPEEAEEYLDKFRGWLTYFPFLTIPQSQTAALLRQEKPFLWMCIMNITTMSVPQMTILKETVREAVGKRVVLDYERSMDLLQGLIVYLAW